MKNFEVEMGGEETVPPTGPAATPVVETTSAPRATPADLSQAHEMLLKEMDAVRSVAKLVMERIASLEAKLAPTEAAIAKQGEMLERAAKESLAEGTREWAETAVRYRRLVDELGTLARAQEGHLASLTENWRTIGLPILGGLLAVLLILVIESPTAARLRAWIGGGATAPPSAPAMYEPPPAPALPAAKAKAPGKGPAR